MRKFLVRKIIMGGMALMAVLALTGCGGGGGGDNSTNMSTSSSVPSQYIEPIIAGVINSGGLDGRAVVGEVYTGKLLIGPADARNSITSYAISNPTSGGAVPSVAADGTVTWKPNAADVNTAALSVTVTLAQGSPSSVTVKIPVNVYIKTLVMSAQISAGQYLYSDPNGTYTVQISHESGVTPSGKVEVISYRQVNGGIAYNVVASDPNVTGLLLDYPRVGSATPAISTQSVNKVSAGHSLSQHNEFDEYGIDSKGARFMDGLNIYTTRNAPIASFEKRRDYDSVVERNNIEIAEINHQVIQIDANCTFISAINNCSAKSEAPVILIHGFTPEIQDNPGWFLPGVIGGGEGTWGYYPTLLSNGFNSTNNVNYTGHPVFEFRWITHMRFEEAAGKFAQLINAVALRTNKKPIVIAHSFGGIVSHLALSGQGIEWRNSAWKNVRIGRNGESSSDVVERLITLGSPIGGIYAGNGAEFRMKWGRQSNDFTIAMCKSISCVQAGASDVSIDAFKSHIAAIQYPGLNPDGNNIRSSTTIGPTISSLVNTQALHVAEPTLINYAESIARIGKINTGIYAVDSITPSYHGVDTLTIVGVGSAGLSPTTDDLGKLGDGLISLEGQINPGDWGTLGDIFQRQKLKDYSPELLSAGRILPVKSNAVENLKYVFIPSLGHTNSLLHVNTDRHEVPEPYIGLDTTVSLCKGGDHHNPYDTWLILCDQPVNQVTHHLQALLESASYLNGGAKPYSGTPMAGWNFVGKITPAAGTMTTQSGEYIPFRLDIRDRSNGNLELRTFSYASQADGSFKINLNDLLDVSMAGFNRANLYANIYLGDDVVYEVQRVSVQNLNLDTVVVPDITLNRLSNLPALVNVSGKVIDGQTTGTSIADATIYLRKGVNLSSSLLVSATNTTTSRVVHTDASGNFYLSQLRPGTYSALVQKTGYLDEVQGQLTVSANGVISLSILKALASTAASVTLRWDTAAGGSTVVSDLDSHMLRFSSTGALDYHIYWSGKVGLDGDSLDRDDRDYEGPETITFNPKSAKNYTYYVYQYTSTGTIPGSKPLVTLQVGGQAYRFDLPVSVTNTARYWRVFDVVNGVVKPCAANCLQSTAPTAISTQSSVVAPLSSDVAPYLTKMLTKK